MEGAGKLSTQAKNAAMMGDAALMGDESMMTFDEVVAGLEALQAHDLTHWVEASWVMPLREGEVLHFSEVDVARVRFLCDMRYDFSLGEEAIPVLLMLLDQVYDLRRQLKAVAVAVEGQPEEVRQAIARILAGDA
jgi:chaperone modulatory protein CbpM